jgi:hypothetical protein
MSESSTDSTRYSNQEFIFALENFISDYKRKLSEKASPSVSLSIFSDPLLGVLESLSIELRDKQGLSCHAIAELLGRDERTIWASYNKAAKKSANKATKQTTDPNRPDYIIPICIFAERRLGPLEALVIYLKDSLNLSFPGISSLLNRSYRAIWLSYKNGQKKMGDSK